MDTIRFMYLLSWRMTLPHKSYITYLQDIVFIYSIVLWLQCFGTVVLFSNWDQCIKASEQCVLKFYDMAEKLWVM